MGPAPQCLLLLTVASAMASWWPTVLYPPCGGRRQLVPVLRLPTLLDRLDRIVWALNPMVSPDKPSLGSTVISIAPWFLLPQRRRLLLRSVVTRRLRRPLTVLLDRMPVLLTGSPLLLGTRVSQLPLWPTLDLVAHLAMDVVVLPPLLPPPPQLYPPTAIGVLRLSPSDVLAFGHTLVPTLGVLGTVPLRCCSRATPP